MVENIPPLTAHLVELYRGPLRDVRFPDADEARLLATIETVAEARSALTRAELAVAAARTVLEEKLGALTQETERALAYARIYAAERPELRDALEAVPSGKPQKRGPGRPRKPRGEAAPEPRAEAAE